MRESRRSRDIDAMAERHDVAHAGGPAEGTAPHADQPRFEETDAPRFGFCAPGLIVANYWC